MDFYFQVQNIPHNHVSQARNMYVCIQLNYQNNFPLENTVAGVVKHLCGEVSQTTELICTYFKLPY